MSADQFLGFDQIRKKQWKTLDTENNFIKKNGIRKALSKFLTENSEREKQKKIITQD